MQRSLAKSTGSRMMWVLKRSGSKASGHYATLTQSLNISFVPHFPDHSFVQKSIHRHKKAWRHCILLAATSADCVWVILEYNQTRILHRPTSTQMSNLRLEILDELNILSVPSTESGRLIENAEQSAHHWGRCHNHFYYTWPLLGYTPAERWKGLHNLLLQNKHDLML